MSYDLSIAGYDFNYTFNLSKLFYDHLTPEDGKNGIPGLHGRTGKQCYRIIMDGIGSLRRLAYKRDNGTPAWGYLSDKYDPDNYWGDCLSAVLFLAEVADKCAQNPRHKMKVDY